MTNSVFIHDTAIVESDNIGEGTKIWAFVHICKGAKIGKNCTIGEGVYIGPDVTIGDNCRIQNRALLYTGVEIGTDVFIGPGVVTTNDYFPTLPVDDWQSRFKKTIIKNNSSIGANSTIVCGCTIGEFSLVGAGSVVTKDIDARFLYFGNPARKIKSIK
jgi:UDP-2-acetamido-3-amino-2,3-dideoxy-glucuronate N-acetyltransferase